MQANPQFYGGHTDTTTLPLDEFLDVDQVRPYYYDDESSEEETAPADSSIIPVVFCRWYNCRKMFKAGTYPCIDAEHLMSHIEYDHINSVQVEDEPDVECMWKFNQCLQRIARKDILKHVEAHFLTNEDRAYPEPKPEPKQWVYCLWKNCRDVFADQDITDIWKYHVWEHIQDDHGLMDATTKIACQWEGCEESDHEFGSKTIAQHAKKHLEDNLRYPSRVDVSTITHMSDLRQ